MPRILTHPLVVLAIGMGVGYMYGSRIPGVNKLSPKGK